MATTGIIDDNGVLSNSVERNRARYAKYFDGKKNGEVNMDTFIQLLVAEMSRQDPLEPTSNTEFVSQMAAFSSLQAQQDATVTQKGTYATSLVGKTVTVAIPLGADNVTSVSGLVTSMRRNGSSYTVTVNGAGYDVDSVIEVLPGSNPYAANSADIYAATSMIGKTITVVGENNSGASVIDRGVVQRVEIQGGVPMVPMVVVNDIAYPLSAVTIINGDEAASTEAGDSTDNEE
ncbi:MAG: hypothetical protein LBN40_05515 [Oscillospiraceae bacterium]|jgi:flagellar basal-body rod modification protein FlgD|nr:hypothetical protein [Oscillospiraceae bacterium]